MFQSSAQAACRLPARRRLALGGLALSTALVAGAFVSTPAFAAGATEVHTFTELDAALTGAAGSITLADDFDAGDAPTSVHPELIVSSKTLDLNGQRNVNLDQTTLDEGVELDVIDSTAVDGSVGSGSLYFNADESSNAPTSGVQLRSGATFHVSGASVFATGAAGGAGIGSTSGAASFIADDSAIVWARGAAHAGSNSVVDGGGAGIGGTAGAPGIDTTIADANVTALGGAGAAGIGGGSEGAGGAVHLGAGSSVEAGYGVPIGDPEQLASSIGAGQDGGSSGSLRIDAGTTFSPRPEARFVLSADGIVENQGTISLPVPSQGDGFQGAGTIHNLGSITAYGAGAAVDPATVIGGVTVTGYNYDLTLDGNGGGSVSGTPTSGHLLSASTYDLASQFYDYFTVPAGSDSYNFWKFNTQANGGGKDIDTSYDAPKNNLETLGVSADGTPVPAHLYAQYARVPYATATDLPDAVVGTPYRAALPVAGDGLNHFEPFTSTDPDNPVPGLPAGLAIDEATGVISGTPTEAAERDVYFYVANTGVSADQLAFHIAVGGAPVFGTASLPSGTAGTAYSTTLAVSGGPATYSLVGGALPAGVNLDAASGAITGTPSAAGTASFTIRAKNRFGTSDRAFTLGIAAAAVVAPAPAEPVLTAVPRTTVKFGHALTLAVTANSTLPVTFKVTGGSLPKGVALNTKTGLISGTAGQSGTFTAEITATSTAGSASTTVVVVVPKVQQLISTTGSIPAVKAGAANVPVKVKGLKKGEKWTVRVDGKLVQHGTMKKAGTLSVKVHLAKAKKDTVHTIRIAGSRKVTDPAKTASTTFTVTSLAAKKTLRVHTVSANGVKLVAVEKLAAGEKVVVKDGRKVIAKGRASAYGIFTFPQSKAGKGTSKLTVKGAAAKRAGTLTVKSTGR